MSRQKSALFYLHVDNDWRKSGGLPARLAPMDVQRHAWQAKARRHVFNYVQFFAVLIVFLPSVLDSFTLLGIISAGRLFFFTVPVKLRLVSARSIYL